MQSETETNTLLDGRPVAALARDDDVLVLTESGDEARIGALSLTDGVLEEVSSLTGPASDDWAAAFLDLPDGLFVQWDRTWWRLAGENDVNGVLGEPERVESPVDGVIASAQTATGVLALTETELVELDESLDVVQRHTWRMPEDAEGQTVTAAVSDGADGLVVATAGLPTSTRNDSGSVLHITPTAVTVLATGHKPASEASTDCEDGDVDAQSSHLAQPVSVAVWEERIMIADYRCNAVLQLPLPDTTG